MEWKFTSRVTKHLSSVLFAVFVAGCSTSHIYVNSGKGGKAGPVADLDADLAIEVGKEVGSEVDTEVIGITP